MPIKRAKQLYKYYTDHSKSILHIAIVVIFVLVIILWRKPRHNPGSVEDRITVEQLDQLKDKNGFLWTLVKQKTIELDQASKDKDSLASALKIKPKWIKGRDVYISKADTIWKNLPTVVMYDTLNKDTMYVVTKKDAWVDIEAKASKKGGTISYSSIDTLNRVVVTKNPLFGRSTTTVYMNNANPYNTIKQGYSYIIKQKEVFLTIGPSISYNPLQKSPVTIGISLQYPIIKFKR